MTMEEFFWMRPHGPNWLMGLGAIRERVRLKSKKNIFLLQIYDLHNVYKKNCAATQRNEQGGVIDGCSSCDNSNKLYEMRRFRNNRIRPQNLFANRIVRLFTLQLQIN
jgi:hypothetical protein